MKFFTPLLLIFISIGLFFTIVNPLRSQVSSLKSDIDIYNQALANSTNLQKTQDQLIDKYKNIKQEDKDRLEHFLPNTVNNIKFILEVERLANQYNMPIKNIKFETPVTASQTTSGSESTSVSKSNLVISSDPKNSQSYGNFSVEFTTEGDYNSFVLFLKDLEHNLRLLDIQSISFVTPTVPAKPGDTQAPYSFSLKVQTYWLK